MAYIMIRNETRLPIHAALSWDGIQQQHCNDLAPGQTHDFVVGLGWHDLTVVPGSESNRFDPKKDNAWFKRIAYQVLGFVMNTPFNTTFSNTQLYGLGVLPPGTVDGEVVFAKDVTIKNVQVIGLYAPDGWTVHVGGMQLTSNFDPASKITTITNVSPLTLNCVNRNKPAGQDKKA